MYFSAPLSFLPLLACTIPTSAQSNTTFLPGLTLAFSGSVDVARPLPPITIPGGVRIVEPITGGAFSGPLLNATVAGGIAYPTILGNGARQDPFITIYGTTADNSSFLAQVSGVGVSRRQFARISLEVGGKEGELMDKFMLATIDQSADRKTVGVGAYLAEKL